MITSHPNPNPNPNPIRMCNPDDNVTRHTHLLFLKRQSDINDVFQRFADREVLRGAGRAATWGIGGLVIAAGVAALGLMWLKSRK